MNFVLYMAYCRCIYENISKFFIYIGSMLQNVSRAKQFWYFWRNHSNRRMTGDTEHEGNYNNHLNKANVTKVLINVNKCSCKLSIFFLLDSSQKMESALTYY